MKPRIFLLHAYRFSMAPCEEAFKRLWPEADAMRLLDESLYADAGADGSLPANINCRLAGLFRHCEVSGAHGIVFTGSTFGPAVEQASKGVTVPLLKADEAMAELAVSKARRILLLATAKRAIPVIRGNLEAAAKAANKMPKMSEVWVEGAQAANNAGQAAEHNQLIAEAAMKHGAGFDAIVLGQMSMAPAKAVMPLDVAARTVTSPDASVVKMRLLLGTG